jgi:hypothetical protein
MYIIADVFNNSGLPQTPKDNKVPTEPLLLATPSHNAPEIARVQSGCGYHHTVIGEMSPSPHNHTCIYLSTAPPPLDDDATSHVSTSHYSRARMITILAKGRA